MTMCSVGLFVAVVSAGSFYGAKVLRHNPSIGKDGAPAVLIPAGNVTLGDDEESPRREIFLDAFYLDKFEVTAGALRQFFEGEREI